jgi:hypothetical protein
MANRYIARRRLAASVLGPGTVGFSPANLLTKTQDLSNAIWLKGNLTVTADTTTAPDGTLTADTLTDNGTSNFHGVGQTIAGYDARQQFNFSTHLKQGTSRYAALFIAATGGGCVVDLQTGTIVYADGAGSQINGVGIAIAANGFYRCYIVGFSPAASDGPYIAVNQPGQLTAFPSYAGVGSTVIAWGHQVTPGATLWPYKAVA